MNSPNTFPAPDSTSQPPALPLSAAGTPEAAASGAQISSPTSITQATTLIGSIIRLERDEHSVDTAHAAAAPSPPSTAIKRAPRSPSPRRLGRAGPRERPEARRPA